MPLSSFPRIRWYLVVVGIAFLLAGIAFWYLVASSETPIVDLLSNLGLPSVAAIITVIGALGSFLVGFAQLLLADRIRRLDPTTLEQHIEQLEAAGELDDLEVQIQEHRAIVDKLSHDAETYQHLKDLNRHELAAVSQVLARELKKEGRRSFWVNFVTNFGFFVAGVVVTLVLSYVTLVLS